MYLFLVILRIKHGRLYLNESFFLIISVDVMKIFVETSKQHIPDTNIDQNQQKTTFLSHFIGLSQPLTSIIAYLIKETVLKF